MGLRQGRPLLVQTPRLLDDGGGVAQQDRMPCEAEDEINEVPMGEPCDHLRGGTMAVPPDEDMGPGPVATQAGEEPYQDHGLFAPRGPRARAEAGRDQGPGEAFKDEERHGAIGLVIVVVEGELLLSVGRIVRVIQVEHDGRRRLWVAGDAVGSQRLSQPLEVLPVDAVFQPREGRRTPQRLLWSQWQALHT